VLLALLLIGCVHRIEVTTIPAGATLYRAQTRIGEAPADVPIWIFSSTKIEARLPGYRPVTTQLRGMGTASFFVDFLTLHWPRALGLRTRGVVEIRMMPEHGPVGTWTPDEVP
jgi:hypothetical protein